MASPFLGDTMNKRNYQKELDALIEGFHGERKSLLLHSCCAPCSSYCLEYLTQFFDITIYYYNPNISEAAEFDKRVNELRRLIELAGYEHPVKLIVGSYEPEVFLEMARGLEQEPERGKRCYLCYQQRMEAAAQLAEELQVDYFTTTLSISPLKNADWINEIGEVLATRYHVPHLPSDFKKREGYKRSIELSTEYNLYRQNYCGCVYSRKQ